MLLDVHKEEGGLALYVLEYNGRDSVLVKLHATPDLMGDLRILSK